MSDIEKLAAEIMRQEKLHSIEDFDSETNWLARCVADAKDKIKAARQAPASGEVEPVGMFGLSAFEVKALAMELHRAADEMSDNDNDYALDLVICESITEDDGSILGGPMLCVRDSEYPEEGVYPVPASQQTKDRYTHPPAKVPEGWRDVIQVAIDELSIMDESEGIAGWHLNGAVATWEESGLPAIRDALTELLSTTPQPEGDGSVVPTGRKHHDLKTDPLVFRQSLNGFKPWEIRRNDRDFVRGDTVTLHETEKTGREMAEGAPLVYTGRKITGVISYVLAGPIYGLSDGWCVFSVSPQPPVEQEGE